MFKSKHSGWTWDLKRTPFGGGGGDIGGIASSVGAHLGPGSSGGGKGSAFDVNPPQAPARDVVQEMVQQRQQAQQQAQGVTPPAQQPVQQSTPVSPFVQQQRQQLAQPQMGIGYQQPGLQSMLARILGMGGGGYGGMGGYGGGGGYMPQGMPPQGYGQRMPAGLDESGGYRGPGSMGGMPSYGRFGSGQNPLAYRPDMQAAQNNTNNVAVGVAEQQRRAVQAQLDAANAQLAQQQNSGGLSGSGGGD